MQKTQKSIHICAQMVLVGLVFSFCNFGAYATEGELGSAIQNARTFCSGISEAMADMKTKAGISTALTGVGTVAGGVALGAGIKKNQIDNSIESLERELKQLVEKQKKLDTQQKLLEDSDELMQYCLSVDAEFDADTLSKQQKQVRQDIDAKTKDSKTWGNVRTGSMAGAALTDAAGAVIAVQNNVDQDLQTQVANCSAAVKELSNSLDQVRFSSTATESELSTARRIVDACSEWNYVDLSKLDDRSKSAAISGGVGAGMGVVGALTSLFANRQTDDINKTKSLNTASNVLAGGTGIASLVSTVFSATQISAIKKVAGVADKCEEALK